MHKDDLMTPIERATALSQGHAVDRIPIRLFYGAPAPALLGWTGQQAGASGRTIADVQKATYETFGCDGVNAGYGLHDMAIAFGAEISQDPNVPPSILKHPVKSIDDLSILDLDRLTIEKDPSARKSYEAVHILRVELGDEVECGMGMTGPFTCASGLVGVKQLLTSLIKKPEQAHQLLAFTTRAILQLSEPFLREDYAIWLSDPVASNTLISQEQFREFVQPYVAGLVKSFKNIKPLAVTCHICGDTSAILDDITACGFDVVSLDNQVDLAFAKESMGNKVHIMGNVDPSLLYYGTPKQIKTAVKECCKKAWSSPLGYTIATGCDTAYGTPLGNAIAFMEEARKCGKYPLHPGNFI